MEEEELLFFLKLCFFGRFCGLVGVQILGYFRCVVFLGVVLVCYVGRSEAVDVGDEWDFASKVARYSREEVRSAIKEKWMELEKMLGMEGGEISDEERRRGDEANEEVELKIFVSSSMGKNLLRSYAEQARKYGGSLVFRGLPDGSWRKLSSLVYEIEGEIGGVLDGKGCRMEINDVEFEEYGVVEVPSFVLVKKKIFDFDDKKELAFDKISGNVGVVRALTEITIGGELKFEAERIMCRGKGLESRE